MKKMPVFIVITLMIPFLCFAQNAPYPGRIGVNISLPEKGGTFVDLMKEHYRWLSANSWESLNPYQVDAQGWPLVDAVFIHDARPVAEWSGDIDDPEVYRVDVSGKYTGSFFGQAGLSCDGGIVSNVKYDAAANKTTFDLRVPGPPGPEHGFFSLTFQATRRSSLSQPGSGFTDLKLIKPGYAHDTDQIFTDDFISTLTNANFSSIRFMGFLSANGSEPEYPGVTEWKDRKLSTDASQRPISQIGKKDGAAWEYIIEMCNLVKMDAWINIQVSVNEDYVRQLAGLFKESLDPDLFIYVESSNEVWNTAPGFEQSTYNQLQAKALGITEHQNHARRTVQLAQLFEDIFGAGSLNSRVRVVLCSHAPMLKWWVEPMLQYINREFGAPKNYLYAIARQTYFGGGTDVYEPPFKVLEDCRANITGQMDENTGNQAGRRQWVQKAQSWGLPGGCCSYEGGPDHGGGNTVNVANQIRAERESGMGDMMKYNLDDAFFALGANLAMQFTLTSAYTRYGCWGLTDDVSNPDRNFKFQAIRDLIGIRVEEEIPTSGSESPGCYPNPFQSVLHVIVKEGSERIRLVDILGRVVISKPADGQSVQTLQTGKLAQGIYFCLVEGPGKIETWKIAHMR